MQKIGIWGALVILVTAVYMLTLTNSASSLESKKEKSMITINGVTVDNREYQLLLDRQRSSIYSYFENKYGVKDSNEFWNTDYHGEVPQEKAKKLALAELMKFKVQQIMGRESGLIKDISYSAFLDKLKSENERRKQALEDKQVIYGPMQYEEGMYYDFTLSNMVNDLKGVLVQKERVITAQNLRGFFDEMKINYYKKTDTIKIRKIAISFLNSEGIIDIEKKKAMQLLMEKAKQDMSDGVSFEKEEALLVKDESIKFNNGIQIFNEDSSQSDYRMYSEILGVAQKLSLGEISDVIEARGSYYIIQLLDKKSNGFIEYETVKEQVKTQYINKMYDEILQSKIQAAHIEINQSEWKALKMR